MLILRHPEYCPAELKQSVIALGNFDGVHKGHRKVIETARALADAYGTSCAVMTFEPHPATVLRGGGSAIRITPFRMKALQIKALKADTLCVLQFSEQFSVLTAEQFVKHILVHCLDVRHVVIGEDFNFGRNRTGNADFLKRMATEYGFTVSCVPPVQENGMLCASSGIRQLLKTGNIEVASALLGYDYTITGRVCLGDQRGRLLGFPTANIALHPDLLRSAYGVYVVELSMDGGKKWYGGVANLGVKPSIASAGKESLEVHIFDFNADIYGKRVEVKFLHAVRPEQKFDSLDALKAQITQDAGYARQILRKRAEYACI